MDSKNIEELKFPHEKKVLGTLASIKSQVTSVLKDIQEARVSITESACRRTNMEISNDAVSPCSSSNVTNQATLGTPTSRDDVKAQREAKKAAKAARKSKGSAAEGSPSPNVSSSASFPPVTPSTKTPELLSYASPKIVNLPGTEESPRTKAQLKAERRALQEAQREAKAKTPTGKVIKKPGPGSDSSPIVIVPDKNILFVSPSNKAVPSQTSDPSSPTKEENASPEVPKTPERPEVEPISIDFKSPEPSEQSKFSGSASVPNKKVQEQVILANRPSSAPKVNYTENEDYEEDLEISYYDVTPELGRIHGLFEWETDPPLDEDISELELLDVDPMFKELGLKYSNRMIRGSNMRTVALLKVVKQFVKEYRTPEGKGFKQDISTRLKWAFDRLKLSRPFAVGMTSAIDGLNAAIRRLEEGLSDEMYRVTLEDWCDTFIEEKVEKAMEAIAQKGCEKIENGDTILVFSLTDVIYHVFKLAGEQDKKFKLLLAITNSDAYLNDYEQLKNMMGVKVFNENVLVSCINISSIMSLIATVNKVFLGGHALFTTGGVMAHAGSSTIALCAMQHNIPTLFFCETFKFCDKSPTDSFYRDVFLENKICLTSDRKNIDEDLNNSFLSKRECSKVITAKIRYDFTPVNLVTCVITDIDMLPSSSVPVVLRVQENRPLTASYNK